EIRPLPTLLEFDYVDKYRKDQKIQSNCQKGKRTCPDLLVNRKRHIPGVCTKKEETSNDHEFRYYIIGISISADKVACEISNDNVYKRRKCTEQSFRIKGDALAVIEVALSHQEKVNLKPGITRKAVRISRISESIGKYPIRK